MNRDSVFGANQIVLGRSRRLVRWICARRDRVDAPWVLNGPINANAFLTYVEKELAKNLSPGDIVVLDSEAEKQMIQ
ncbi:hypothetical protein CO666_32655 [Rhizobium chutanense]|uniref:Uncharacterized protein n=1 Tax=Rhizobium chutanense TaxID=2035448 RepID=A0A2A6J1P6_9HYPH|nr:hypothetical protein [Rhizobium chutanense]PDT00056.1 hypothetical protein CO666_32655 [Rhizobium chutanense]